MKLKSNQVYLSSVKFHSHSEGKRKQYFSRIIFRSAKFANGTHVMRFSLGLLEVTLISSRFVIFEMKFSQIQL